MERQFSKGRTFLFYAAIIMTNVVVMHDFVIVPITNTLYEIFPDSVGGVNFIVSGPAMVMVATSLLAPYLLCHISRKKLLSIACVIFALASTCGAAVAAVPYMILCRALCGFAYGVVQVVSVDLIACYFADENKRASFMGIYNTGMSLIGVILGLAAGTLATTGWRNAYKAYWLAIPMVLLVLLFVPDLKPAMAAEAEILPQAKEKKKPMGRRFWIMLTTFLFFTIGYGAALSMLVSLYVFENGLGNEAFVGMLTSVNTCGSAIFCMLFGLIYGKLKTRESILNFVLLAAAVGTMACVPAKAPVIIACFLGGAAYGMQFTYMYSQGTLVVAQENISRAISYIAAVTGFAMFVTPHIFTALMRVTGSFSATLPLIVVVLVICTAAEWMNTAKMGRK